MSWLHKTHQKQAENSKFLFALNRRCQPFLELNKTKYVHGWMYIWYICIQTKRILPFYGITFLSTLKNCHWPKREKTSMTSFDKVKDSKKLYTIIPPTVIASTKRKYVTTNSILPNLARDLPNKKKYVMHRFFWHETVFVQIWSIIS